MATLIGIAVRPEVDAPMSILDGTTIREESGVDGDYRRGRGARQVTVLFKDSWEAACDEVGVDLPWTTRRANLMVEGMTLANCRGAYLAVGDTVLEVTGETVPCNLMEEAQSGLRAALAQNWRGGVTCRVIRTGDVTIGDRVGIVEPVLV